MKGLLAVVLMALTCYGARAGNEDSATYNSHPPPLSRSALEGRIGLAKGFPSGALELRIGWGRYLSTDLQLLRANGTVALHFGLSVYPLSLLFIQGLAGIAKGFPDGLDGPTFDPDYSYGIRGGILISILRHVVISLSMGGMWAVQTRYCANCGGLIPSSPFVPIIRTERVDWGLCEIGMGIRL